MSALPSAPDPTAARVWIGVNEDSDLSVAIADRLGWVEAGTGEPLPDPEAMGWTRLVPAEITEEAIQEAARVLRGCYPLNVQLSERMARGALEAARRAQQPVGYRKAEQR